MTLKIIEECIKCATCEADCPENAISEGEDIFIIDSDSCVDCGLCISICPVDAIIDTEN